MDFTALIAAVDGSSVLAALGAIAAVKILPGVAKWGYGHVVMWFDSDAREAYESQQRDLKN